MVSFSDLIVSPVVDVCIGLFFGLICSLSLLSIVNSINIWREARKRGVSTSEIGTNQSKLGRYLKRFTLGRLAYSKLGLILNIFTNLIIIILSLVLFAWFISGI